MNCTWIPFESRYKLIGPQPLPKATWFLSRSLQIQTVNWERNDLLFRNKDVLILLCRLLTALFQAVELVVQDFDTTLLLNKVSRYSGILLLYLVLLLAYILHFALQTLFSLFFSVPTSKWNGGRLQRIFCWCNAFVREAVLDRAAMSSASSNSSPMLTPLFVSSSACAIWSSTLQSSTVPRVIHCLCQTHTVLRYLLGPRSEKSSICHVLLDWLRCRFVALLIVSSLNLDLRGTVWRFYMEDWKNSPVMSS